MALLVAGTAPLTLATYVLPTTFQGNALLSSGMAVASLGIFVAPLFAILFVLSALFAPSRPARVSLLAAAAIEIMVCMTVVFVWFGPLHR